MARVTHLRALGWLRAVARRALARAGRHPRRLAAGQFPLRAPGEENSSTLLRNWQPFPRVPTRGVSMASCPIAPRRSGSAWDPTRSRPGTIPRPGPGWRGNRGNPFRGRSGHSAIFAACATMRRVVKCCRAGRSCPRSAPPGVNCWAELALRTRRLRSLQAPHCQPRRAPCPAPGGRGGHAARRAAQAMDRRRAFRHARRATTGPQGDARDPRLEPGAPAAGAEGAAMALSNRTLGVLALLAAVSAFSAFAPSFGPESRRGVLLERGLYVPASGERVAVRALGDSLNRLKLRLGASQLRQEVDSALRSHPAGHIPDVVVLGGGLAASSARARSACSIPCPSGPIRACRFASCWLRPSPGGSRGGSPSRCFRNPSSTRDARLSR